MTRHDTFRQTNAFAMIDGLKFGAYWAFGFLCFAKGIGGGTLQSLALMVIVTVPIFGGYLARKFEAQVRPDGIVGFGKAYLYSALIYFYASAIMALVAFGYLQWFDHGVFAASYVAMLHSPEMTEGMKALEASGQNTAELKEFIKVLEEAISHITPGEMAASLFNSNILVGLVLSLPTALFGMTRRKDRDNWHREFGNQG